MEKWIAYKVINFKKLFKYSKAWKFISQINKQKLDVK